jgi:hypothetical protein
VCKKTADASACHRCRRARVSASAHRSAGRGRHRQELQSVFVFVFFSLAAPKHLNEPAGWRMRLLGYPDRDFAIFGYELGRGLLGSLSLASLRRSAIAELAGPALEFPSVIERMMLPKFLGRLKAE